MSEPVQELLLTGIGRLVTCAGSPGELGMVEDAAVWVREGKVAWAGPRADLPLEIPAPVLDVEGRCVLPGFVDPHTHAVFAGDRSEEFALRLEGFGYEELLAAGGGIMSTVRATRSASLEELVAQAVPRLRRMAAAGTTTVEVKSGYGLDTATERRMLEAAHRAGREAGIEVVATFLGAHVVPAEMADRREEYLRVVVEEMLPACAPLARFCDVFCDRGAFTVEEARQVLEAGRRHGLRPRLHAEQLTHTGAADLACEVGAASADHLDHLTAEQAAKMAASGVAAVLIPGAALSLRTPPPPVETLIRHRVLIALATDCNPGTSYVETMPFVVAMAVLLWGMPLEQAVWAATRGGALALDLPDRGLVQQGATAHLVVLDADHPAHLAYRPDTPLVWRTLGATTAIG